MGSCKSITNPLGVFIMFVCEVYEVEGQAWDVVAERETYLTTRGRGMNLRSAKKAMDAAKAEFRKAAKKNAVRYPIRGSSRSWRCSGLQERQENQGDLVRQDQSSLKN